VLARLGPQTGGLVTWRDLTALPCSHPHCCSVGYLIRDDVGAWRSLVALVGPDRLAGHLGLLSNRIADDELPRELAGAVREALLGLLSEQSSLSHPSVGDLWRDICGSCDLGLKTLLTLASGAAPGRRRKLRELLGARIKRITVKPFMDIHTMLEERLTQCCVHVGTRSAGAGDAGGDQCAPFCAVQAWAPLGAQKLAARRELPVVL
jgi:7,8-dihydro-6-hydroxymethylpterin dimethyltransferase